jgi:hypothetical protein
MNERESKLTAEQQLPCFFDLPHKIQPRLSGASDVLNRVRLLLSNAVHN